MSNKRQSNSEKTKKKSFLIRILKKIIPVFFSPQIVLVFGVTLVLISFYLFASFFSHLFTGKADMSLVTLDKIEILESGKEIANWFGYTGAKISYLLIYQGLGLGAFLLPPFFLLLGIKSIFKKNSLGIAKFTRFVAFFSIFLTLLLGFLTEKNKLIYTQFDYLTGRIGREFAQITIPILGWGTVVFLILILFIYLIFLYEWKPLNHSITSFDSIFNSKNEENIDVQQEEEKEQEDDEKQQEEEKEQEDDEKDTKFKTELPNDDFLDSDFTNMHEQEAEKEESNDELEFQVYSTLSKNEDEKKEGESTSSLEYKQSQYKATEAPSDAEDVQVEQENYDPTKSLSKYKFPSVDLLEYRDTSGIEVSKEELQENKNKIVKTLSNFKIGITKIKATIGPTVTLYELVPEPGVKISRIKSLEDDIALGLSALGIRMIAPIPGRGTIGIEVPNINREMVSARSVIQTEKFLNNKKELPVVLGKTISNEVFVVDLAKMPHLLIAGATGQGKSVGLNILLASLIYKKHPAQLKFVLVDPKKVELTLFKKLEKHFLAQLPNAEEAIITDNKKVVNTLNSLCIEMDRRYDLLKMAEIKNIKEYNEKFINRKLNPNKGHAYMPYIVLVIDELADLMMSVGKEVETPIARLAQLARAVGIHLVLATQRPSVNVITGVIKANFPARLSFRVTSSIDSKTILDQVGASQLIGQGDMLLSMNSEIVRLQCAFIDTPEIERICSFIGEQTGYNTPFYLPEYSDEEEIEGITMEGFDLGKRDDKFLDVAFLVVDSQKGSTSNIQRRMDIGYNRAGRIMDELEVAGIVGPQKLVGKPRKVLVNSRIELEEILRNL